MDLLRQKSVSDLFPIKAKSRAKSYKMCPQYLEKREPKKNGGGQSKRLCTFKSLGTLAQSACSYSQLPSSDTSEGCMSGCGDSNQKRRKKSVVSADSSKRSDDASVSVASSQVVSLDSLSPRGVDNCPLESQPGALASSTHERAEPENIGAQLLEDIITTPFEKNNGLGQEASPISLDSPNGKVVDRKFTKDEGTATVSEVSGSSFNWRRYLPSFVPDSLTVPHPSRASRRLSLSVGFELPRFRKRRLDSENINSDDVSVHSLDVEGASFKKKSKRSLLRVSASLVNLISSNKSKNGSDGFKVPRSPLSQNASPYKPPKPSPAKRRSQLTWVDWVAGGKGGSILPGLSHTDIKRQEAIYELYQGEKDMAEDLVNVTKMYRDSLVTLGLMSLADVGMLFGNIDSLIPIHEDLVERLQGQRKPDGTTHKVGKEIHEWAIGLNVYVKYCANQIRAKAIFDEKKNEPSVDDFFQRCLASPFSRKLDLWTLLDGPRGRFVKYPLLVRSILKYTPCDSADAGHLEKSIRLIERIIHEADEQTGLSRCEHSKSSLVYLFDEQKVPEIEESKALVCSGCMKSTKGSKLYVFLFDKVAVVSRPITQGGRQMYQIYRQPIPATELVVEDLPDGEVKMGSFRSAFGQGGQTAKNLIRISFQEPERGQAHTLIVSDEHDKRQWMQAFHKVTSRILVVVGENKAKERQLNS